MSCREVARGPAAFPGRRLLALHRHDYDGSGKQHIQHETELRSRQIWCGAYEPHRINDLRRSHGNRSIARKARQQ